MDTFYLDENMEILHTVDGCYFKMVVMNGLIVLNRTRSSSYKIKVGWNKIGDKIFYAKNSGEYKNIIIDVDSDILFKKIVFYEKLGCKFFSKNSYYKFVAYLISETLYYFRKITGLEKKYGNNGVVIAGGLGRKLYLMVGFFLNIKDSVMFESQTGKILFIRNYNSIEAMLFGTAHTVDDKVINVSKTDIQLLTKKNFDSINMPVTEKVVLEYDFLNYITFEKVDNYIKNVVTAVIFEAEKVVRKSPSGIEFEYMYRRNGVCYDNSHIVLNTTLLSGPLSKLVNTLCHEYAHLRISGHNGDFYKLLEEIKNSVSDNTKDFLKKVKYYNLHTYH